MGERGKGSDVPVLDVVEEALHGVECVLGLMDKAACRMSCLSGCSRRHVGALGVLVSRR
jgi:hypothetical protein